MSLSFDKYHGLGNDFIVVDVPAGRRFGPDDARLLCDRHFGVGADGLLLLSPSQSADAKLVILNADGSRPEMCGNGLRCVALHLKRKDFEANRFLVETDAGVLDCLLEERDEAPWITISLGRASLLGQLELNDAGSELTFERVSIGNPHAVLLRNDYDTAVVDRLGPLVSGRVEGGANVEFVRVVAKNALDVVVWERGVGRTLACGTGAGAAVMAAAERGLVDFDGNVTVTLPGGDLDVRVGKNDHEVQLIGPAQHVFEGALLG